MASATNVADGSPITSSQIDRVVAYLEQPGSGAYAHSSFEAFVTDSLSAHPAALPAGYQYVFFSGTDDSGFSNIKAAQEYTRELGGGAKAGIIGDTPWGAFIDQSSANTDARLIGDKFKNYLDTEGIAPFRGDVPGAIRDMMWNAGSTPYMQHAIDSRLPAVAFVQNAPRGRGFDNHELPRAASQPDFVMNGYKMSAFGSDPLQFSAKSAIEFRQLESSLAYAAGGNSGHHVNVPDLRMHVNVAAGYDATEKSIFDQPLNDFQKLNLRQMSAASDHWQLETPALTMRAEVLGPERPMHASEAARATSALHMRGLAIAGAAAVAYDTATTAHKTSDLLHTGNTTGAQSEVTHFASRNLGMLGGAEVVGSAAMLAGVESGPGVIVFGAVGAVAGAVGGDTIANAIDNHRIYNQKDSNGQSWHYDPKHPDQGWNRSEVVLREIEHASPHFDRIQYQADASLSQSLSYKATNTAVELTLAREYTPKDPYSQAASPTDTPSVREANWTRDPQTHAWSRQVVDGMLEHGMISSHREIATPERTADLNRAVGETVATNLAASPKGVAEQYLASYEKAGWHSQGPVPEAVSHALGKSSQSYQASDGHVYTQTTQGQWQTPGMLYGTNEATGNVRDELNATQLASTHAAESSAEESAAGTPSPAQSMSRSMAPGGLDEQARMQASMHGGDAAARNQAARQLSEEHKVEAATSPAQSQRSDASHQPAQVNERDEARRHDNAPTEDHRAASSARVSTAHQVHEQQAARVAAEGIELQREAAASMATSASAITAANAAAASAEKQERDEAVRSADDIKPEQPPEANRDPARASPHEGKPGHHTDSRSGDGLSRHQPAAAEASYFHGVQEPDGVEHGHEVREAHKTHETHEAHDAGATGAISPAQPQNHVDESPHVSVGVQNRHTEHVEAAQPVVNKAVSEEAASSSVEAASLEALSLGIAPTEVAPKEPGPTYVSQPGLAPPTDAAASIGDTRTISAGEPPPELDLPTTAFADSDAAPRPGELPEQPWPGAHDQNDITFTHAPPMPAHAMTSDAGAGNAAAPLETAATIPAAESLEPDAATTNPFGPGSPMEDPEIADLWFALQSKNSLAIDQACERLGERPEAQQLTRQADQFVAAEQMEQMNQAMAMAPDAMVAASDGPVMMMTLLNNPSIPSVGAPDQGGAPAGGGDGGGGG